MAVMDGEEVPEPPKPRSNRFTDDITEFAGTFTSTGGQVVVFNTKGSTLFLQADSEAIPLDQRGKDTFYTSSPGRDRYMVRFERNENKEIVEVFHGPNWYVNNVYEGPKTFSVPESWTAHEGAYRNYSPWFPFFEIFIRKGKLLARTGTGGESSVGETPLTEIAPGLFQAGKSPIPERVRFDTIVDGKALRAAWSGHLFYRVR